ncbi:MAG: hypothetical protein H7836_16905, partial [Magnetococcus sp. YQC-3]
MNLDYVTTNEFGEQVISTDPTVGIPTKGKYRFRVKWSQPPDITLSIRRGDFLIPNIKEWNVSNTENYSYAFSLDWEDYGDPLLSYGQQMISEAINCEDRFYEMRYNKVYTTASLISEFKQGKADRKFIAIKSILDDTCESTNYKFPTNDAVFKEDFAFSMVAFLMGILVVVGPILILVMHIVAFIACVILSILALVLQGIGAMFNGIARIARWANFDGLANKLQNTADKLNNAADKMLKLCYGFKFKLCLISYPDCEACETKQSISLEPQAPSNQDNGEYSLEDNDDLGVLTKFYGTANYTTCGGSQSLIYSNLMIGFPKAGDNPPPVPCNTCGYKSQGITKLTPFPSSDYLFTSSLTLPHRLNLFNTKGKYFDSSVVPGGGVNQKL